MLQSLQAHVLLTQSLSKPLLPTLAARRLQCFNGALALGSPASLSVQHLVQLRPEPEGELL